MRNKRAYIQALRRGQGYYKGRMLLCAHYIKGGIGCLDATRYLVDFDTTKLAAEQYDIIIIGGGIAGIYTALEIPEQYSIAMLVKESMDTSNSVLAQGGVAAPLDKDDSPRLHFRDTVYASAGLCDEKSVWILVNEAADNINALCGFGVDFDRKDEKKFSFSKEGAHSKSRIVHAGDTTGKEICDKLINVARMRRNITIKEKNFAIDLLTVDNNCKGVLAYDGNRGVILHMPPVQLFVRPEVLVSYTRIPQTLG